MRPFHHTLIAIGKTQHSLTAMQASLIGQGHHPVRAAQFRYRHTILSFFQNRDNLRL
jgi:hypothetical protein